MAIFAIVPLVFVLVGGGGIYAMLTYSTRTRSERHQRGLRVFGGVEHRSDNYNFWRVYSSSYAAKRQIADSHPVGSKFPRYVNSRDPADAVIDRAPSKLLWVALLPLAAVIAVSPGSAAECTRRRKWNSC